MMTDEKAPLYVEIYQNMAGAIQSGRYPENTCLPSERHFCEKYHVSRYTVRQALRRLREENLIYSVHGHGSFVKPRQLTCVLSDRHPLTAVLARDFTPAQTRIVSCELISADASLAKCTAAPVGTRFHRLVCLRLCGSCPLILETTYLPLNRFVQLDLAYLSENSLDSFLLEHYHFRPDHSRELFRPVMPRPEEKNLLQISSAVPCLLLECRSFEGDLLGKYTRSLIRGDKYTFCAER